MARLSSVPDGLFVAAQFNMMAPRRWVRVRRHGPFPPASRTDRLPDVLAGFEVPLVPALQLSQRPLHQVYRPARHLCVGTDPGFSSLPLQRRAEHSSTRQRVHETPLAFLSEGHGLLPGKRRETNLGMDLTDDAPRARTALQQGIDLLDLRNSSESLLWSLRRLW